MTTAAIPGGGDARLAEAAAWRVRLTESGLESCAGFEEWMSDPANAAAWAQVSEPWDRIGDEATSPEIMAARAAALSRARKNAQVRWTTRRRLPAIAAAMVVMIGVAAAGVGGWVWWDAQPDVYRTEDGERRVVRLADGSTISLDAASEVRVRYTEDARRLELVDGQARFEVARNPDAPFSVQARDQRIVATGTAFNVDLLGSRVLVTLIEGQVEVMNVPRLDRATDAPEVAERAPSPVVLEPGEQLVVGPAEPASVIAVSTTRTTAWETGRVEFENEPLSSAVERISRYGSRNIRVEGAVRDLAISGVFRAGDVDTFIDAVTAYLPVEAAQAPNGEIALRERAARPL